MIKVKICGITRLEDALDAERAGVWALGFIFYTGSKRYIHPEKAAEITKHLKPSTEKIGVFVNESYVNVIDTIKNAGLTAIQLHGSETPEFVKGLGRITKVIKSFRVGENFNCSDLGKYEAFAVLLDTYKEKGCYGGTGVTFDWNYARECKKYGKVILAGGLNENNIIDAIKTVEPWGIDISSGVEISPGIKDTNKIEKIFQIIEKESGQIE